ncbi:MAG: flagellar hook-length control protein FliK [Thalassovita sp.]
MPSKSAEVETLEQSTLREVPPPIAAHASQSMRNTPAAPLPTHIAELPKPMGSAATPSLNSATVTEVITPVVDPALGAPVSAETTPLTSQPSSAPAPSSPTVTHPVLQHLLNTDLRTAQRTEITLSPEELGKLRLIVQPSENGVVIALQAERPETLELMRRHAEMLTQELRSAGYTSVEFEFSTNDQSQRRTSAGKQTQDELGEWSDDTDSADPIAVSASGRLDIRL